MTDPRPHLSVLTVVLNDVDGLQRTLASILGQSFADWELIIKDGDSTDGTAQLAARYARSDSRIRLIAGGDSNLYDAMNIALAAAHGRWVLLLNAGDWLADAKSLETAFACVTASQPPPDIAYFGTRVCVAGGQGFLRRARDPKTIRYGQPAIHQSVLIKTDWHRRYPYDHVRYPNIADYAAVACMVRDGAGSRAFGQTLSVFEVDERSSSYRHQSVARAEFIQAIDDIWAPGTFSRFWCDARRRLSMLVMRALMRARTAHRNRSAV
jgi:glycosyltransferase involved in cell wall biosynthesis